MNENLEVGDVVFTCTSARVLDLGLVECTDPLTILSKSADLGTSLKHTNKRYFGSAEKCDWTPACIKLSYEEWERITLNGRQTRTTEEVCELLDVPYRLKRTKKKKNRN